MNFQTLRQCDYYSSGLVRQAS